MDPKLEFYYTLLSQPARVLYILLKVNNISFESREMNLMAGEHKSEEFAKINPRKKVPAIRYENFCLSESIAIVRFLASKYQGRMLDHWYPKDVYARARIDEYLSYQHLNTRFHCTRVFIEETILPNMGKSVPEAKHKKQIKEMRRILAEIQDTFLKETNFINSEEISVADLFAISEILQMAACGWEPWKDFKRLEEWMDRVRQHIGQQLFDETFSPIYAMGGLRPPRQFSKL